MYRFDNCSSQCVYMYNLDINDFIDSILAVYHHQKVLSSSTFSYAWFIQRMKSKDRFLRCLVLTFSSSINLAHCRPLLSADQMADPCKYKLCWLGGHCSSPDGLRAECECSGACFLKRKSRRPQLLCGTDFRQYQSECELQEAACRLQKFIGVKRYGPCSGEA